MNDYHSLKSVYQFYDNYVKEAISGVQAASNDLPMEFLLEIYSAFDDIKLFFADGKDEAEVTKEIIGHLKRATLDCYKTHLVLFNEEVQKFEKNYDLTLLDNGTYYPKFKAMKYKIHDLASKARSINPSVTAEQEFDLWKEIYNLILNFKKDMIAKYQKKAVWARKRKILWQSLAIGVLSNFLFWLIVKVFFS